MGSTSSLQKLQKIENHPAVDTPEGSIVTEEDVRKYFCKDATPKEVKMFIELCKMQNLNPFIREAYLVKYGNSPANIIVSYDVFKKRAARHPMYNGMKAYYVYKDGHETIIPRDKEVPHACRIEVFRKDREYSTELAVLNKEYNTGRSSWKSIPYTMLRKVAVCQGLREAFPEDFHGLYSQAEMDQAIYGIPKDEDEEEAKKDNPAKNITPKQPKPPQIDSNRQTEPPPVVEEQDAIEVVSDEMIDVYVNKIRLCLSEEDIELIRQQFKDDKGDKEMTASQGGKLKSVAEYQSKWINILENDPTGRMGSIPLEFGKDQREMCRKIIEVWATRGSMEDVMDFLTKQEKKVTELGLIDFIKDTLLDILSEDDIPF